MRDKRRLAPFVHYFEKRPDELRPASTAALCAAFLAMRFSFLLGTRGLDSSPSCLGGLGVAAFSESSRRWSSTKGFMAGSPFALFDAEDGFRAPAVCAPSDGCHAPVMGQSERTSPRGLLKGLRKNPIERPKRVGTKAQGLKARLIQATYGTSKLVP